MTLLTIQILTKNNEQTIEKTLRSIQPLDCPIVAIDMGSKDNTIEICQNYGVEVVWDKSTTNRSDLRNKITQQCGTKWQMYIEPWETLNQGHMLVLNGLKSDFHYLTIIRNTIFSKEIRIWKPASGKKFINPVFERIDSDQADDLSGIIYSGGNLNFEDARKELNRWKNEKPMDAAPFYYEASLLMAEGKYEEFMKSSSHYMFIENKVSMSSVMNRYYYAFVSLYHFKQVKPTLQNLALCLEAKPLMAEFWCLTADVHYHLLNDFDKAKKLYENAIFLGRRRLKSDEWPMDVTKYGSYPEKMIASCDELLKSTQVYSKRN